MDRRLFLRSGSLAGMAISAMGLSGFSDDNNKDDVKITADDFELDEITITALQNIMNTGKQTPVSITKKYLARIAAIDKAGPKINSVIEINKDALSIAAAMDKERKARKIRGPLHGIPVLIKDNIDTADAMMTTAGSLALVGNKASKDAFIVTKLREAGAIILGKTNLSEWANFRSTSSTSGWSSRGGQTKCPYMPNRNPSGSSAGSGAAAAANLCAVAIGTETDGSIVSPSSKNGLVGFKPTVGLWSRTGIIPISATQDTAGPMTRTVTDAAILLGAVAGPDPLDKVTAESVGKYQNDYTKFLVKDGLKGKRIGIEKNHLRGDRPLVKIFKEAMAAMEKQGAIIVEIELLKNTGPLGSSEFTVLEHEFKDGVDAYLKSSNAKVKTLKDVIDFNSKNEKVAMPYFKQETLISSEAKKDLSSKEYTDALAKTLTSRTIINKLMADNTLDAVVGITSGPAACTDLINGDYNTGYSFSSPAAMAGFPHITVPMGFVQELPVGISFISTAYTEGPLLSIAYAYEQATMKRKKPSFLKDVAL